MRPYWPISFFIAFVATLGAEDLVKNGVRVEMLGTKNEALLKSLCTKVDTFEGNALLSCYPKYWMQWIKAQKTAVIPASQRAALDACNMESPARAYLAFPGGAKLVVWNLWEQRTDNRAFWLVDASSRDVNVIWIKDGAIQYFGKRAAALLQAKLGEWLNEIQYKF